MNNDQDETTLKPEDSEVELQHFCQPYDWVAIDTVVQTVGGVILDGFMSDQELTELNDQIDEYLAQQMGVGAPSSGSNSYDKFLGYKTVRLHGLLDKVPLTRNLMGDDKLVDWAKRALNGKASSILLNAGELIQIEPGEPLQFAHRDTDSWAIPIEVDPVIVNAIFALDDFTTENGATHVAPGSWQWESKRMPKSEEYARAVMSKGDVLLFRGDLIHCGGKNDSENRRRALSISFCAGWLRPVENSYLNLSKETVCELPQLLQDLVGYAAHDGADRKMGMVGLYENGDPRRFLEGD